MDVAAGEVEVLPGPGVDVRDAVAVDQDLNRRAEAGNLEGFVPGRDGPLEQQTAEADGPGDRGEDPRRDRLRVQLLACWTIR
jgi:hypothetical protein